MSSNATLVGIALILVIAIPIIYAIVKSKASARKTEKLTASLIEQNQLNPTDLYDDLGNQNFILDTNAKKLLHLEVLKSKITQQHLWDINNLKIIKADYSHYTSPSNQSIIDKIILNISPKDGDKITIEIYDENTGNMSKADDYKNAVENLVSKVNSLRS
ncbi:hypothetical protein [Galbibacter sp.]|uniref:hypothetical protein n=1 Tax=Galbibacter sp. TaxID=2918471 RepID=UPI003A924680